MKHYRRALYLDPHYNEARLGLGKVLFGQGQQAAALDEYEHLLADVPNHANAHVSLGAVLDALGRPGEARDHYQAALRIRPDLPIAHFDLGNLALREPGKLEEAVAHYEAALEPTPHTPRPMSTWAPPCWSKARRLMRSSRSETRCCWILD